MQLPGAARRPQVAARRLRHPGRGHRRTSGFRCVFDTRDTERALEGTGDRRAASSNLRRQALGLLGAQPRPGPVQGPLAASARSTARRSSSPARSSGHRQVGGAEDRRRRRHPAARRAQRGEARGGQGRDRGRRRHARTSTPPTSPTWRRSTTSSSGAGRPRRDRRARQQRGPLDPPLDLAQPRPLPRLRAHDAAQLLRRDPADHRRCCRTCASASPATW